MTQCITLDFKLLYQSFEGGTLGLTGTGASPALRVICGGRRGTRPLRYFESPFLPHPARKTHER